MGKNYHELIFRFWLWAESGKKVKAFLARISRMARLILVFLVYSVVWSVWSNRLIICRRTASAGGGRRLFINHSSIVIDG